MTDTESLAAEKSRLLAKLRAAQLRVLRLKSEIALVERGLRSQSPQRARNSNSKATVLPIGLVNPYTDYIVSSTEP